MHPDAAPDHAREFDDVDQSNGRSRTCGAIYNAVERLETALDAQAALLRTIEARLGPLLLGPFPPNDDDYARYFEPSSPHVEHVDQIRFRVEDANQTLQELLLRLTV